MANIISEVEHDNMLKQFWHGRSSRNWKIETHIEEKSCVKVAIHNRNNIVGWR